MLDQFQLRTTHGRVYREVHHAFERLTNCLFFLGSIFIKEVSAGGTAVFLFFFDDFQLDQVQLMIGLVSMRGSSDAIIAHQSFKVSLGHYIEHVFSRAGKEARLC